MSSLYLIDFIKQNIYKTKTYMHIIWRAPWFPVEVFTTHWRASLGAHCQPNHSWHPCQHQLFLVLTNWICKAVPSPSASKEKHKIQQLCWVTDLKDNRQSASATSSYKQIFLSDKLWFWDGIRYNWHVHLFQNCRERFAHPPYTTNAK